MAGRYVALGEVNPCIHAHYQDGSSIGRSGTGSRATQVLNDFDPESPVPPPTFSFTVELNGGFSHRLVIAMAQPKKSVMYRAAFKEFLRTRPRDSVMTCSAGAPLAQQEEVGTEEQCEIALANAVCVPLE
ncbi:hypothetical protein BTVI_64744 [Pitangus sulphuratus]|nr:hypothetical protein BTVI_64744 [Pitangus sulphuratus]